MLFLYYNGMDFEFDAVKSAANEVKHGIGFIQAQLLWEDDNLIVVPTKITGSEIRDTCIGLINGKCWFAVITYRATAVRIISVRRARKEEIEIYECR